MLEEQIKSFAVALFIGLLIGIERERSHPEGVQAYGVRTFTLLSLLGCLAAYINTTPLIIIITLFVFGLIAAGYLRSTQKKTKKADIGLTTEFSAGVVYCLGYIAYLRPLLASILGVFVLLILIARKRLHIFSREQLKPGEIQAASALLVIGLGILPFLPDKVIDHWHLFNPRQFGILVLLIASIQFGGYVAIRLFGERLGLILTGFFGGLVSSTVVFATLSELTHEDPPLWKPAIAAALFAVIAMMTTSMIVVLYIAPDLFLTLVSPVLAMMAVGLLISVFLIRQTASQTFFPKAISPLNLKSVLKLSLLLGGMIFLVGLTKYYFGTKAFQVIAFLGALFELHSVTLATSSLYINHQLAMESVRYTLGLAIVATMISKWAILGVVARNRFAALTSVFLLLMLSTGVLTYILT
jgi:uncharacterized membrane protein (DUF4010 family)